MGMKTNLRRSARFADAALRHWLYRYGRQQPDETHCRFIGSHGLKKVCDYWDPEGKPPHAGDLEKLEWHGKHLPTIYVKTNYLSEFARGGIAHIEHDFTLVSGCCDIEAGPRDTEPDILRVLLDHPHLKTWYAQNSNLDEPKMRTLPLGLDYHTLTFGIHFWPWGHFSTPVAQEASLDETRNAAPQLADKAVSGYCNWHHVLQRGDRLRCINGVAYDVLSLEQLNVRRTLSWSNNAQHLFTISPLGMGLDCHRTWEAILLGSVPIVPKSGISSLFEDLPVCVVDDWSEVTVPYLRRKRDWALETEFDFAPLYLDWWRSQLRGKTDLPERRQTFQAFMDTASEPLLRRDSRIADAA
ncbi:hypothetical protein [Hoeflea sp.]|uniref:hypothetical protein n=1 Tax=Hoeflea sp. TaxID=1940281 RepID=UPI003B0292C4